MQLRIQKSPKTCPSPRRRCLLARRSSNIHSSAVVGIPKTGRGETSCLRCKKPRLSKGSTQSPNRAKNCASSMSRTSTLWVEPQARVSKSGKFAGPFLQSCTQELLMETIGLRVKTQKDTHDACILQLLFHEGPKESEDMSISTAALSSRVKKAFSVMVRCVPKLH